MLMDVVCPHGTISKFVCLFFHPSVCLSICLCVQYPSMHLSPCSSLQWRAFIHATGSNLPSAHAMDELCLHKVHLSVLHMSVCLLGPSDQNCCNCKQRGNTWRWWCSYWAHQSQGCLANSWLAAGPLKQINEKKNKDLKDTQRIWYNISATMFDCVYDNVDNDDEAWRWPQGCIWELKSEEAYSPTPPSHPPLEKQRNTVDIFCEEKQPCKPWSYTSVKLRPSLSLTGVRWRATSN